MKTPVDYDVRVSFYPFQNKQVTENKVIDPSVSESLQKAKAALYQKNGGRIDPNALNLISLAENALKNGNTSAADNFADKAARLLLPEPDNKIKNDLTPRENKKTPYKEKNILPSDKKAPRSTHMYQDSSSDGGVSFKYPAPLTAAQSFIAVPAHEAEHVSQRVGEAILKGEKVEVYVSYVIRYDPNTGEAYMAGGVTHSKIYHKAEQKEHVGTKVDLYA